jgi:hypothetical protein
LLGGQGGGCAWGHEDINLERDQFGRESGEPLGLPLGVPVFDHEVAALDVTEVMQSLKECLSQVGVTGRVVPQPAYSSSLGRLLGLANERRGQEASSRHDEGAAIHYWMIPEHGIVSPSALAV